MLRFSQIIFVLAVCASRCMLSLHSALVDVRCGHCRRLQMEHAQRDTAADNDVSLVGEFALKGRMLSAR